VLKERLAYKYANYDYTRMIDSAQKLLASTTHHQRQVLLIIDVQNDFCIGGALAVPDANAIVPLINQFSAHFAHVICTQDWHCLGHISFVSSHPGKKLYETIETQSGAQVLWPDHCVANTHGAEFDGQLDRARCEFVVRKGTHKNLDSYSAFLENDKITQTGLHAYLQQRELTSLFLVGLATDYCVAFTAIDARKLVYQTTLLQSACRAIDMNGSLERACERMDKVGVSRQ